VFEITLHHIDAEEEDEWSKDKDKDTVWDSIEGSSTGMGGMGLGGDLADFAAAALKFRADTSALYGLKGEVKEEVRGVWSRLRRCIAQRRCFDSMSLYCCCMLSAWDQMQLHGSIFTVLFCLHGSFLSRK
jgi:hypothetical protein